MSHRELIESFYAAGGPVADTATLERVFHHEYVSHNSPPGTPPGLAGALGLRGFLQAAFSDIRYELIRTVVEGDEAATYTTFTATHSGDAFGLPATQRRFTAEQMHLMRFAEDGRIVEHWGVRDDAGMMRQLSSGPPQATT
jgi:predicted ester cyclase